MQAMRYVCLLLAAAACGGAAVPPPVQPHPAVPRLLAPPLLDADAPAASYLTTVALALQPAWHQFLEDCRLRLPADHALNRMALTAIAELELDRSGNVTEIQIESSGNRDFDRAARQVIEDASPLPPPPRALWSDDDHMHLAWMFARDRRQAGPATAHVVHVTLPLRGVVARRIAEHDLARAARRILLEPAGMERERATRQLMVAALRAALASSDLGVRRAAVLAVARAGVHELRDDVRALAATTDLELATTVIAQGFVPETELPAVVERSLDDEPRLAMAALQVLADRAPALAADVARAQLATHPIPDPAILQVLAIVPLREAEGELIASATRGQPGTRAAACQALGGYHTARAWSVSVRGLADRDASVRASCLVALGDRVAGSVTARAKQAVRARVRTLTRDRDAVVRARALGVLAALDPADDPADDPAALPDASDDRAAEVRVAFVHALAHRPRADAEAQLLVLADDRDPEVRAAAWTVLASASDLERDIGARAARAMTDSAPQVRLAALPAVRDDALLARLATRDESSDVRTAALVQRAQIRTRHAMADALLERIAGTPVGSAEHVRSALAWLLAR